MKNSVWTESGVAGTWLFLRPRKDLKILSSIASKIGAALKKEDLLPLRVAPILEIMDSYM